MTAKQKANRERFKKVVAEAKKLRAKNKKLTQAQAVKQAWAIMYKKPGKKVGATKIVQKGQSKNAKVTKVLQQVRTKKGQFKGYKRIAGERHTDTKSHNVNIRVVSGIGYTKKKYSIGNVDSKKLLTQIAKESKLKADVVKILNADVKDYKGNYKELLKDILYGGLQSGIISELIYYDDTKRWYKKHAAEIKNMLKETMFQLGAQNPSQVFGKNWDTDDPFAEDVINQNLLAWYSFEETAREIADRLGFEI